jgi:hypothetical protein
MRLVLVEFWDESCVILVTNGVFGKGMENGIWEILGWIRPGMGEARGSCKSMGDCSKGPRGYEIVFEKSDGV